MTNHNTGQSNFNSPRSTKKKTLDDYRKVGAGRFEWLGDSLPKDNKTPTLWRCLVCSYEFEARYNNIQQGSGCPKCSKKASLCADDYHAVAEAMGLDWVGSELPRYNHDLTEWLCRTCNHRHTADYNKVQQRRGCPECGKKKAASNRAALRLTEEHYHERALRIGLTWTASELPANNHALTTWRCKHGHEITASIHRLRDLPNGCPVCNGKVSKTANDYKIVGLPRSIEWLGTDVPDNIQIKTLWSCGDHVWETSYNVIQRGSGCPYCAANARKTIEDYHSLADELGITFCDNTIPRKSSQNCNWQCANGHDWYASYANVRYGFGCPHCQGLVNGRKVSKIQRDLCNLLQGELNYRVGVRAVDVAIFIDEVKIAVEYDEAYWHIGHQERDLRRVNELIENGWRVLCIKANYTLPSLKKINEGIKALLAGETYHEIVHMSWHEYAAKQQS